MAYTHLVTQQVCEVKSALALLGLPGWVMPPLWLQAVQAIITLLTDWERSTLWRGIAQRERPVPEAGCGEVSTLAIDIAGQPYKTAVPTE